MCEHGFEKQEVGVAAQEHACSYSGAFRPRNYTADIQHALAAAFDPTQPPETPSALPKAAVRQPSGNFDPGWDADVRLGGNLNRCEHSAQRLARPAERQ